jgi:murein DD-endopeptidase MepM/ murein hydrolase activator NlpD
MRCKGSASSRCPSRYAFYAHIIPGTITVKVGDQVKKGQVLGRLGNSGNSDAPHLHFHLGDANAPLGSEGIPWVFERFERLDKLGSLMAAMVGWKNPGTPSARTRELPLENEVVNLPYASGIRPGASHIIVLS